MYCSGVLHHIERWNILWPSWRNFDCIIQYTPTPYNPKSCPEDPPPLCAVSSFLLLLLLGTVYSSSSILSNLSLHHVSTWFPFLCFLFLNNSLSFCFCSSVFVPLFLSLSFPASLSLLFSFLFSVWLCWNRIDTARFLRDLGLAILCDNRMAPKGNLAHMRTNTWTHEKTCLYFSYAWVLDANSIALVTNFHAVLLNLALHAFLCFSYVLWWL